MNTQFFVAPSMQEDNNGICQMRFPQKLWYLLNMGTDAIMWGGTGRTILLNYKILHNYLQCDYSIFKTANISSFVRQLNLYGFRKVTSHLQDPLCNSSNPYMHEYTHDNFQYGRPELLNKITRKALLGKKHYKASKQLTLSNNGHFTGVPLTPLQKARRAFHRALHKAAQDLCNNTSNSYCNFVCDDEEVPDDCMEEDNTDLDPNFWIPKPKPARPQKTKVLKPIPEIKRTQEPSVQTAPLASTVVQHTNPTVYEQQPQDLTHFPDMDESQNKNDSFSGQFLSMPDLDPEPTDTTSEELLAEFDIYPNSDQGNLTTAETLTTVKSDERSLNCLLPFAPNDDVNMDQNNNSMSVHYQDGEWDQMFTDMLAARGSSQETSSELKELYSQISITIDLLNAEG